VSPDRPAQVFLLPETGRDPRPYSPGHLRLLRPASHPSARGWIRADWGLNFSQAGVNGVPDAVVVERAWHPAVDHAAAAALVERVRRSGARLIYAIDDNLPLLAAETPEWFTSGERAALEVFLKEADGVFVSTQRLADALRNQNGRFAVVPNLLDERLLVWRAPIEGRATDRPLVIGYMGTRTHAGDLAVAIPALERVCRRWQGGLRIEVVGGVTDDQRAMLSGLPVRWVEPPAAETEYPLFMLWMTSSLRWDVAIAPLADTEFNACKSDVKFLDYTAIGVPAVFSDAPAYRDTVVTGVNGLLAGSTTEQWEDALETLLASAELRGSLLRAASRYLYTERTLGASGGDWARALHSLIV
jgi:processive 1,2-diacylglycerol beta-glucosyltransferase